MVHAAARHATQGCFGLDWTTPRVASTSSMGIPYFSWTRLVAAATCAFASTVIGAAAGLCYFIAANESANEWSWRTKSLPIFYEVCGTPPTPVLPPMAATPSTLIIA